MPLQKRKTSIRAQDANRIINLHHLVILFSSATTTGCDHRRVLIDNLRMLISDLKRLVSWRHELRKKVSERGLGRCIELGDHLPGRLPEERQVSFWMLTPNVVNKRVDAIIEVLNLDLLKLS